MAKREPLRYEEVPDEWVKPIATALARPWGDVRRALTVAAPVILASCPAHQPREAADG